MWSRRCATVIARYPAVRRPSERMSTDTRGSDQQFGLRRGAEEFPLMVVHLDHLSVQLRLPELPVHGRQLGDPPVLPPARRRPVSGRRSGTRWPTSAGHYGAWMRCTGGGEPMLHPKMVDMIEFAKAQGARVWMNTNGSMFGPTAGATAASSSGCSRPASI